MTRTDILAGYTDATVDTLLSGFRQLVGKTSFLFITGGTGTGKTWTAIALARAEHARLNSFVWWPDFIARHRALDRENPQWAVEAMDALIAYPHLILDDVGAENQSDYGRRVLMALVEPRRHRPERYTIITSNLSVSQMAERYDERLASRIDECATVIELSGPDRRKLEDPNG